MISKLKDRFKNLNLSQRFMLAGLLTLFVGALGIGFWVENQIITGVIHRAGATTALYVESFVAPNLQELGTSGDILPENALALANLLQDTPLGQQIVAFKVWDTRGKMLYSNDATTIGRTYPMTEGLLRARLGEVVSEISELEEEENLALDEQYGQLLETYSPVWLSGTNQVIAVAEFYHLTEDLEKEITVLKRQSWLVVGFIILTIYLLLSGFVRNASNTISRQQAELNQKVNQLTDLLSENQKLNERVRKASASVALLNEGYLKRIGSELHDGPAQDLGLSILKLDAMIGKFEKDPSNGVNPKTIEDLTSIEHSMQNALKEMRGIATGLALPQLNELDLIDTISHVVHKHEQQTNTRVQLEIEGETISTSLPIRITIYRLIQEALHNAFHHARGAGQSVCVKNDTDHILLEIGDTGPGFDVLFVLENSDRLGISGMRERVESIGGRFEIESQIGKGTTIRSRLPKSVNGERKNGRK
ncbi:MAG: sensor histidine kinase [Anaerolineaceae bacterium]|nr:sensor histidine kinase [Anaerolineaceae bacterium]